jgi:hypothetical protein
MNLDRQLVLNVKGNQYTVDFPNVGNFQKIEALKQVLSSGMYRSMIDAGTVSSTDALDMIDIQAYLSVLCPKLIKDLKCNSFEDLGLEDYLELRNIYREQFSPWWLKIMELLNPKK